MTFDNIRLITGPEADQAIAMHRANEREVTLGPYCDVPGRLPDTVIENIWSSHRKGFSPARIASCRSTADHPVTKSAVLRVLAGGLG